jgi:hypothetical protein
MKKLAIGCGLVLLVLGVAAAGVAYYAYRQVSTTLAQFQEFSEVPDLERDVRNQDAFVPPASAELTDIQIDKLVKVQAEVRRRLGERMAAFEAKYKTLTEKKEASIADAAAILSAYGDLASTWVDAKRGQIEALNATGLSLEEYRWIRDQAYRALGQPFADLDIGKFVEDMKSGGGTSERIGELKGSIGPAGPESNRKRIERVKKLLEENLSLAAFGL